METADALSGTSPSAGLRINHRGFAGAGCMPTTDRGQWARQSSSQRGMIRMMRFGIFRPGCPAPDELSSEGQPRLKLTCTADIVSFVQILRMWECTPEPLQGGRVVRYAPRRSGLPVAYPDILRLWQDDKAFRSFFISLLADAPFAGYRWRRRQ